MPGGVRDGGTVQGYQPTQSGETYGLFTPAIN